MLGKA